MKGLAICLAILATTANAQRADDAEIASRLTADLLPLKSVLISTEPMKDGVYTAAELQGLVSVGQHRIMQSCQMDLVSIQRTHALTARRPEDAAVYFGSFFGPDQAYKLTHALAGKDLSDSNVRPLAEGIVGVAESALDCGSTSCQIQDSPAFRGSTQKVWDALQALGVTKTDLRVVIDALLRGAERAAEPPVRATYK